MDLSTFPASNIGRILNCHTAEFPLIPDEIPAEPRTVNECQYSPSKQTHWVLQLRAKSGFEHPAQTYTCIVAVDALEGVVSRQGLSMLDCRRALAIAL